MKKIRIAQISTVAIFVWPVLASTIHLNLSPSGSACLRHRKRQGSSARMSPLAGHTKRWSFDSHLVVAAFPAVVNRPQEGKQNRRLLLQANHDVDKRDA
jgi:hypothetical protein